MVKLKQVRRHNTILKPEKNVDTQPVDTHTLMPVHHDLKASYSCQETHIYSHTLAKTRAYAIQDNVKILCECELVGGHQCLLCTHCHVPQDSHSDTILQVPEGETIHTHTWSHTHGHTHIHMREIIIFLSSC